MSGGEQDARLARQIPFCKAMEILLVGEALAAEEVAAGIYGEA